MLHEERKQKGRAESDMNDMEKAMMSEQRIRKKGIRCHYCKRIGHFQRDCFQLAADRKAESEKKRQSTNKAEVKRNRRDSSSSESESIRLVTRYALSTTIVNQKESWII